MYDTDSDGELIRLAQRGDRGAFSALFARHGKAVYLYAWGQTRDDRDAEETGARPTRLSPCCAHSPTTALPCWWHRTTNT